MNVRRDLKINYNNVFKTFLKLHSWKQKFLTKIRDKNLIYE